MLRRSLQILLALLFLLTCWAWYHATRGTTVIQSYGRHGYCLITLEPHELILGYHPDPIKHSTMIHEFFPPGAISPPLYDRTEHRFLGFAYGSNYFVSLSSTPLKCLALPFWFLTLLTLLPLLYLLLRRPKINPATSFPIQPPPDASANPPLAKHPTSDANSPPPPKKRDVHF